MSSSSTPLFTFTLSISSLASHSLHHPLLFLSPPHHHSSLFNPLICLSSTPSPLLLYLHILLLYSTIAISDESTEGISQLVSKQRLTKPKNKRGYLRSFPMRYPRPMAPIILPRWGRAPPAVPAQLRAQLCQLISQVRPSDCVAQFWNSVVRELKIPFIFLMEVLIKSHNVVTIQSILTTCRYIVYCSCRSHDLNGKRLVCRKTSFICNV